MLLFFLFWEVELVPMYFLIAMWGTGHREYSAMKFVLYTLFGSAFMLVGVLALRFAVGSFDMEVMTLAGQEGTLRIAFLGLDAIFLMFLIAFAIKLPVWPLHTWLPDAHTDAPTAVSVLLAGVLLKMGGYGLIRINVGMFPDEMSQWAPLLVILSVISVLYGAAVVFRQTDLKRLVAYSSVSHMGLVLLGVASLGAVSVTGAALQMFAHGTITGLMFLVVGIIYENAHTRHIPDLGGLMARMPVVGAVFVLAGLASLGLPLLSGFAAELMVFLGSFDAYPIATGLAVLGIVLTAGYILWTVERVLLGPLRERWQSVKDASPADFVAMALLVIPIIIVGVYPALVADVFRDGVMLLVGGGVGGYANANRRRLLGHRLRPSRAGDHPDADRHCRRAYRPGGAGQARACAVERVGCGDGGRSCRLAVGRPTRPARATRASSSLISLARSSRWLCLAERSLRSSFLPPTWSVVFHASTANTTD